MDGLNLTDQSVVELHPLHIGEEDEGQQEVGRAETGVFIALPPEGVALIRFMQEGLPLGEVKARFAARYGQAPDLEDFVTGMADCGFVIRVDGHVAATVEQPVAPTPAAEGPRGWRLFAGVPTERVAWLVSRPMRLLYPIIWLAVPAILLFRWDLIPSIQDVWVSEHVIINTVALTITGWALTFLHETAHLLSVRALGCTGVLSISHRLHFLVAQVDMTGVRTLPRTQRYMPYLAGMTWDLTLILTCLLLQLAGVQFPLLPAIAFILTMGLLFQAQFYMRTDLYYVFANRFRLGNLMEDTQHWLANLLHRTIGRQQPHDLSAVPDQELKPVRWYAGFYVIGISLAVGQFIFIGIPLMIQFFGTAIRGIMAGPGPIAFWDGLLFLALTALNYGLLGYVSWRERRDRRRQEIGRAHSAA